LHADRQRGILKSIERPWGLGLVRRVYGGLVRRVCGGLVRRVCGGLVCLRRIKKVVCLISKTCLKVHKRDFMINKLLYC